MLEVVLAGATGCAAWEGALEGVLAVLFRVKGTQARWRLCEWGRLRWARGLGIQSDDQRNRATNTRARQAAYRAGICATWCREGVGTSDEVGHGEGGDDAHGGL